MLLKEIGESVCVALIFVSISAHALDCREGKVSAVVYQRVQLGSGEVCLVESDKGVEVVAVPSNGGPILRNSVLVDKSDVVEGVVHVESVGSVVKIYFEYPNNVYSIDFGVDNFSVKESLAVLTLRSSSEVVPNKIILKTKPDIVAAAGFELVDKNELFGKNNLVLDKELEVRVSVGKSKIYRMSNIGSGGGMYLVKGDVVRILSYHDGWFEFIYKQRSGKNVKGWIPMSSVI